jgi:hypothetical protein
MIMGELIEVNLLKEDIQHKIQLAYLAGFEIIEIEPYKRYCIKGADSWCDNNFKSVDEILRLIQPDLYKIKYRVVAA